MADEKRWKFQSGTRFGRFFDRVNQLFKREPAVENKLSGRIKELQTLAEENLLALIHLIESCKNEVDPHLFSHLNGIIDPLVKEIARLRRIIEEQESATLQVKTYHRFSELLDKAKKWIELGTLRQRPEVLKHAIIEHAIIEFEARVDRDIQVVQDYLNHFFDSVELDSQSKQDLQKELEPFLHAQLVQLQRLKTAPLKLTLEALTLWREEVNHAREELFSEALHIIDAYTSKWLPSDAESLSEHTAHLIVDLALLEEKIADLAAVIDELEEGNEKQKKQCFDGLNLCEDEAHQLNSDLSLSQEHSDKVQQLLQIIAALREQVS